VLKSDVIDFIDICIGMIALLQRGEL
jgi:hypothetical protein